MSDSLALGAWGVFWVCFLLILHTYVCYPIILFFAYSLEQTRRD